MEKVKKILFCSSSIKWSYIKLRLKKYASCNWPEVTTYCGCCTVPHGIYIRSVITMVITILTVAPNAMFLVGIIRTRDMILSGNMSFIENRMNGDIPDRSKILAICNALIAYYIAGITIRTTYILFVVWTMYAVYAKHTCSLKVILFLNIPFWVIELFLSIMIVFFVGYDIRIVLIIGHISELYNILAIRSYYMKLRGKSRLVSEAIAIPTTTDTNSMIGYPFTALTNKHCRTCNCIVRRSTLESDILISTQQTTLPNVPIHESTPIDFSSVVESVVADGISVIRARGSRPLSLDLPLSKVDFTDEPVIYDKAQLNVGSSPILEDRCYTSV